MVSIADCGQISENSEKYKNIVKDIIGIINNYTYDASKDDITVQEFEALKNNFTYSSDTAKDNYYLKDQPKITKLYFTKTENVEIGMSEVADPYSTLCLRAQVDSFRNSPLYAVPLKINSTISNRERTLTLKRDLFNDGYYCTFQPNSRESESADDNLIDVDPRQANPEPLPDYPPDDEAPPATPPPAEPIPTIAEADISQQSRISAPINVSDDKKNAGGRTISIAQCDTGEIGYELKVPAVLYKNGMDSSDNTTPRFFTKALVRSYVKQPVEDVKNNVCPNSQAFLISGGGEYIVAGTKSPNDEFIGSSKLLVKRVANWFMIQGHGSKEPTDNAIGEKGKNSVQPSDIYYRSSSGKCYSFYEGMDVLILDTCYNLCNHKFRGWRKVLPKGVILGYTSEVAFISMDQVLDKLMQKLKNTPNITPEELGEAWKTFNEEALNNKACIIVEKRPWSYGYIIPCKDQPNKSIYHSGLNYMKDPVSNKYYIIDAPETIF